MLSKDTGLQPPEVQCAPQAWAPSPRDPVPGWGWPGAREGLHFPNALDENQPLRIPGQEVLPAQVLISIHILAQTLHPRHRHSCTGKHREEAGPSKCGRKAAEKEGQERLGVAVKKEETPE